MSNRMGFITLGAATILCGGLIHAAATRSPAVRDVAVPPPPDKPITEAPRRPEPDVPGPRKVAPPERPVNTGCLDILARQGIENREAICRDLEPVAPPTSIVDCGGERVAKALRSVATCAKANGVCMLTPGGQRVTVSFDDLIAASAKFPLHVEYFGHGDVEIVERGALRAFVAGTAAGEALDFVVVGSASPTAVREEVDHRVAGDRAMSVRTSVYEDVAAVGGAAKGHVTVVYQANVGRSLPADYCAQLAPASQPACKQRDANARRQAAFIIAYPRACAAAPATAAAAAEVAAQ